MRTKTKTKPLTKRTYGLATDSRQYRAKSIFRKIEKCNDYLLDESTMEDEFPSEAQERVNPEDIVCTNRNV